MGYSIMTPFKNKKDRDLMFDFLNKNYINVDSILGTKCESTYTGQPGKNEDISYPPDKNVPVIGFDYGGSDFGRVHAFLLCYWMSKMIGKESIIKQLDKKCKYVLYDGDEKIYLLNNDIELKNLDFVKVNDIGFRNINKNIYSYKEKENGIILDEVDDKLLNELKRLTELWNKISIGE